MSGDRFSREIEASARKLAAARAARSEHWRQAALLGVGGWLLVVPVVVGAYLGRWLDRGREGGRSWTITLIVIGVAVGVVNFWNYYRRRR